ncbi:hypothetical protein [Stenotrophomonas maltophilia]|uniref:hypothetical protein n=1 Tax=Stenotrophomonas maltophilia TaxID=40324 RepID=UPI00114695C4|nr:hypothetical protein [Stenotrophomonas maltophilia]MCD5965551.1 hypothetical protein [Stenotrophomonas maltophilia]QGL75317.1 hypothetical protein FEO95_06610 [Stenotrophomonas maltophilia]
MGMFGWIKSQVFGKSVSKSTAQAALTLRESTVYNSARRGSDHGSMFISPSFILFHEQSHSMDDLVRENDVEQIRKNLSEYSGFTPVTLLFQDALKHGNRLEMMRMAAVANEGCFLLHLYSLDSNKVTFERDVGVALELVGMGVLDDVFHIGEVLVEFANSALVRNGHQPQVERVIDAIIRRRTDLSYTMVLDQSPASAVHDVLRIMYKNGCNFQGGPAVAPETFFYCESSPGLISDLVEWGVRVERPSVQYDGKPISAYIDDVAYIHAEIDEGERRIAEREAANITRALADADLTKDIDAPKPKRRM